MRDWISKFYQAAEKRDKLVLVPLKRGLGRSSYKFFQQRKGKPKFKNWRKMKKKMKEKLFYLITFKACTQGI